MSVITGEDTALAPLIPRLVRLLGPGGQKQIQLEEIAAVGETYVRVMRSRHSTGKSPSRIVDKMLHNAWNIGYIAILLPKVSA